MAEVIVGIDLGTSNCVVSHCAENGEVQTLADESGYKIHPSVVSFLPSGGVVVGAEAKQRKVIDPQNTIFSAKRLIGRSFRSPEVQLAKGRMPYQIREGANQLPLISTRAGEFAIPEISAVLLDYVRNIAAQAMNAEVNQAVITVPANFNDAQRTATATAGAIAGITVVRVLNEPTAAALAYGHSRELRQTIAVYDFGGGTFDVTILRLDDQVYEVLGTAGDSFLGGDDLDERLVDRMVERFLAEQRIDLRNNEVAMMRLRAVAEQTKIELSRRNRAVVRIDEIAYGARGVPLNLQIEITRDEFVAMVSDIIMRTFPVCQESLKLAGLGIDGIDDIVLVGGTTKVPVVRDQVAKFFNRAPRNDINPEEAVAVGAALQASSLQRILARGKRPSSMSIATQTGLMAAPAAAPAAQQTTVGNAPQEEEATSQSTMPPPMATAGGVAGAVTAAAGARARRTTADIATSGMRPFSERPMTRGLAVDRYESKEPTATGVAVGRMESGRIHTSATGATAVGLIPAAPGEPGDGREHTSTRRSYVEHDEEESTTGRPPLDPSAEDTSTGAPMSLAAESTRSALNPQAAPSASGRRPAPIGYSSSPSPSPLAQPGSSTIGQPGVPRRRSAAIVAQVPPPLPPTQVQPAQAPPSRTSQQMAMQPGAQPPPPPPPRLSQPRLAVRDSLPAIDPSGPVVSSAELALGALGSLEDAASAASTAPGMTLPYDPAVTARGLVPNLPTSLAGQSLPGMLQAHQQPPAVTARGVAPAMPTMMIGTGLASAGPDQQQQQQPAPLPAASGPRTNPRALTPLPAGWAEPPEPYPPHQPYPPSEQPYGEAPVSSGPQARTMMAQAPELRAEADERFPPPGQGQQGQGGYGNPQGGYGGNTQGAYGGSAQSGYGQDPYGRPAVGHGPPGLGPIPGGGPGGPGGPGGNDAFSSLPPPAPGGAQLHTPMPFAPPPLRRPGDEDPFFGASNSRPVSGPNAPTAYGAAPGQPAAQQAYGQAPPPLQQLHAAAAAPSPVVLDVTPFGLGLATVAGFCEELIRRNTRVPTEIRRSFSTSRDSQDVVRIVVCQGESRRIDENVVIGELVLSDLPRKPRGETSIDVTFAIDASGILHVRARDALSGREQRASLNVIGTIPEGDVAASRNRMQQLRR